MHCGLSNNIGGLLIIGSFLFVLFGPLIYSALYPEREAQWDERYEGKHII
jgi:hypothetical protein